MSYYVLYGLSILLMAVSAGLAVVLAADPASFGISLVTKNWLGVVAACVGVISGLLPRVTKPPSDARIGKD